MSVPNALYFAAESDAGALAGAADERGTLPAHDVEWLRAPNPGPLTLGGTNTWLVGRGPTFVVDPGPLIDSHMELLTQAIGERDGLGGIVLTHDHADHSEAVAALRERHPAPLAAGRGEVDETLRDGGRFGPFEAIAAPGHAVDHFVLIAGGACFSGDAVLGEGSVFVSPYPGAMSSYLRALGRLLARDDLQVICPGHGPVVTDPQARVSAYLAHRLERERRLLDALGAGQRSVEELLDSAWSEVPTQLRPAAAATLAAHLDKLAEEGRLPAGVERPGFGGVDW